MKVEVVGLVIASTVGLATAAGIVESHVSRTLVGTEARSFRAPDETSATRQVSFPEDDADGSEPADEVPDQAVESLPSGMLAFASGAATNIVARAIDYVMVPASAIEASFRDGSAVDTLTSIPGAAWAFATDPMPRLASLREALDALDQTTAERIGDVGTALSTRPNRENGATVGTALVDSIAVGLVLGGTSRGLASLAARTGRTYVAAIVTSVVGASLSFGTLRSLLNPKTPEQEREEAEARKQQKEEEIDRGTRWRDWVYGVVDGFEAQGAGHIRDIYEMGKGTVAMVAEGRLPEPPPPLFDEDPIQMIQDGRAWEADRMIRRTIADAAFTVGSAASDRAWSVGSALMNQRGHEDGVEVGRAVADGVFVLVAVRALVWTAGKVPAAAF